MNTISIDGWYDFREETNTEEMNIDRNKERNDIEEREDKERGDKEKMNIERNDIEEREDKERNEKIEELEKRMKELHTCKNTDLLVNRISTGRWYSHREVEKKEKETNTEEMNTEDGNKEKDERINELEKRMMELDQRQKYLETMIHTLTNENLKMINRVLEAEIALERSKNSLIRNHIPFHFSPSPLAKSFGNM